MRKLLSTLLAFFLFNALYAQNEIKGITVTGIKGIEKSLNNVLAQQRTIPDNFIPRLRPELEGPRPRGQQPGAKKVSKFGTMVNADNYKTTAGSAPTQAVQSNFLAIWGNYGTAISGRESPYTPPDNNGDVGPSQIIATANCRMKVFNKPAQGVASTTPLTSSTTTLAASVNLDLNVFFTNATLGINSISDPHVRYDRLSGRWFIVAIEVNHNTNNYCCVAVSDGPVITASSNFKIYYFNVSQTGGASNDFFDYPTLGVDKNSLYIGGNMFANSRTFSGCDLWVINKSNLLAPSPYLTVTGFPQSLTHTDMYTPQGVHNDDPAAANGYFAGASQTYYSKLNIRRVSYSGSTPTLSGDIALTTIAMSSPKTVPTLGGTSLDGNDRRLCAAMIKKNKITGAANLWIAQGTRLNSSGIGSSTGDRDGALWLEIENLSTAPSIRQSANLYDDVNSTSTAVYYTYPTIAVSGQGHNVMGFTSAGPAKYTQAGVAGRYRTDPFGNFQSPVDITNAGSGYNPGANRWGDYTQTVVDPTDDMTIWTFIQYVPATNAWGVRAVQLKAPPPATPSLASLPACGATTTITINGTSTNNAEFFDPGADAGGPGFNHLNVSVTGPGTIGVSNIVFVNPTHITASFTVPAGAASGPYILTVTNPDGQIASTQFSLNCVTASCGDPTSLSSNVTNTTATVSWTAVSGVTSYSADYAVAGSNNWFAATVNGASAGITGLTPGTNYDWRVRATCSGVNSNYVQAQFTTTNTPPPCDDPSGLSSSAITNTSATVSWSSVNGATSYSADYAVAGTNNWFPATVNGTSADISGLTAGTTYDFRVRTTCSGVNSSYASSQFTTTNTVTPCADPSGLFSSAITNTTATVSWNAVSGATGYTVDYAVAGSGTWSTPAITTSSTSVDLSGLTANTNYDWRVGSNCGTTPSVAQFTTTNDAPPPPCNAPTGLASTVNSDNTVTVNWGAVSGANSYDVRYAVAGTNSWTNAATGTTSTSANISGLNALTTYDWQVRSNCSSTSSSYTSAQFTTNCADQLEQNNTFATAAVIPVGTNITAQIATATDVDFYSFSTSGNQKNLKVTLSALPADYTLTLYNSSGNILTSSAQPGTTDKTVIFNGAKKPDTYKVSVKGTHGTESSATQCYTLNVATGNSTFTLTATGEESGEANNIRLGRGGLKLYPVPATNAVTISFDAYAKGTADIIIINQLGQQVLIKKVAVNNGTNLNTVDVTILKSGVYTLKVNNGKEIQTGKMIINK